MVNSFPMYFRSHDGMQHFKIENTKSQVYLRLWRNEAGQFDYCCCKQSISLPEIELMKLHRIASDETTFRKALDTTVSFFADLKEKLST